MITISVDQFLLLYVCLLCGVLVLCWGRMLWRDRQQSWRISEETLCRCRACGLTFVSRRLEHVSQCPSCHVRTRVPRRKAGRHLSYKS